MKRKAIYIAKEIKVETIKGIIICWLIVPNTIKKYKYPKCNKIIINFIHFILNLLKSFKYSFDSNRQDSTLIILKEKKKRIY